jgi:hypothetical protein
VVEHLPSKQSLKSSLAKIIVKIIIVIIIWASGKKTMNNGTGFKIIT